MVYQFIQDNHYEFGVNWLLRRFKISSNAYYNYLKKRKAAYHTGKERICNEISIIYHENDDFIITANSREIAEELKSFVSMFLESRGLMLS